MTGLQIVTITNHWRLIDGAWHLDIIARRRDGALRLMAVREDLVPTLAVAA